MTDLLLDLPNELIRALEQAASARARSLEEHIRVLLYENAPSGPRELPEWR